MFDDGKLYYQHRIYILVPAHADLVQEAHSSPASGHGGVMRTITLLSRNYWWPGLSSFVRWYVAECTTCQACKMQTDPTVPPVVPLPLACSRPFSHLSVDLITDLPPVRGFDLIMVVVDHGLSKGVILTPCTKTVDTAGIAQLFFDRVFKRYGLYNTLISNHDPQFALAFA